MIHPYAWSISYPYIWSVSYPIHIHNSSRRRREASTFFFCLQRRFLCFSFSIFQFFSYLKKGKKKIMDAHKPQRIQWINHKEIDGLTGWKKKKRIPAGKNLPAVVRKSDKKIRIREKKEKKTFGRQREWIALYLCSVFMLCAFARVFYFIHSFILAIFLVFLLVGRTMKAVPKFSVQTAFCFLFISPSFFGALHFKKMHSGGLVRNQDAM